MKRKIKYILLFLVPLLLMRCANQVAPTGGPKDVTPPKVVGTKPANGSVGFIGSKIQITFDEYITLNNATRELLVSPPLTTKPDVKLSNKTVTVKFKENLRPNTTYTIDFGAAIKDFHEGNQFNDYRYSFSTGEVLDSLSLSGTVLFADNEKPAADLLVGLYADADSVFFLPLRQAPDFIAKTDKDGHFTFYGLPDQRFFVTALEDMNANLYHDLPNERVAFIDTLVSPTASAPLTLHAFAEADTTQALLESKLVEEGLLRFVFRQPATDVTITSVNRLPDTFKNIQVWSPDHDTLCWYFTPGVSDSLRVNIHGNIDTLVNRTSLFNLNYRSTKTRNERAAKTLMVSNNLKNNLLMPGDDLLLHFKEPVVDVRLIDSIRFEQADEYGMSYRFVASADDLADCDLQIPDSVFYSLRGYTNAAVNLKFKRAEEANLGAIIIKVCPPAQGQVIVQLLNNRGAVMDQQIVDCPSEVAFRQLVPGKYKLQAIIDADHNGRWSTGNLLRHALPEAVVPYKNDLEVRAGWDIAPDETWEPCP